MVSRVLIIGLIFFSVSLIVVAGPPFLTDDPEPVEYQHWEVYFASQGSHDREGTACTAPHFELNYGVVSNVQLHLIAPFEYVKPNGADAHYGFGDMELGTKVRFVQETDSHPQLGIFPIALLPTGDKDQGLGSGETDVFLPLWAQKNWEEWTTYGGGGYWINPGAGNRNYWLFGWEVQRDITKQITLGSEVFHHTPDAKGGDSSTGFNAGAIINFNDLHHLLLSVGHDFSGPNTVSFYAGYQLTFGP